MSEDFLLKEEKFKELRDRLLKSASDFYGKLGALLGKDTDIASRRALAQSNFELADLTGKVGRNEDALAAHRAVLAAREALAAEPAAGVVAKVDVGRSLIAVAGLLEATGKTDEALASYRRSESLLAGPAGADPSARAALAACRSQMGWLLRATGKSADALAAYRLARADQEALAAAPEASNDARHDLADTIDRIGVLLFENGQAGGGGGRVPQGAGDPAEAGRRQPRRHRIPQQPGGQPQQPRLAAVEHGQAGGGGGRVPQGAGDPAEAGRRQPRRHRIPQRPGDRATTTSAGCCGTRASRRRRRPSSARRWRSSRSWPTTTPPSPNSAAAWRKTTSTSAACCRAWASQSRRRPSTARRWRSGRSWPTTTPPSPNSAAAWRPATTFSADLLSNTGKPAEAEAEYRKAMALYQKLADDDPAVTEFRSDLAWSHRSLADLLSKTGKPAEAEAEYRKALATLAEAGRRQPRRHRIPQQPGGQPLQPRHPAVEDGQASGGGGRVPQGAGDPAEAGRRQPL